MRLLEVCSYQSDHDIQQLIENHVAQPWTKELHALVLSIALQGIDWLANEQTFAMPCKCFSIADHSC